MTYKQEVRERFERALHGQHLNDCRFEILAFLDSVIDEVSARTREEVLKDVGFDCGTDGCGTCKTCQYESYLEWVTSTRIPGAEVETDPIMEAHLIRRSPSPTPLEQ